MKKRVLITGGAGFVGSHLVHACLSEGWQVAVLYQPECGLMQIQEILDQIKVYPVKGTQNELFEIFTEFCPDLVFHLASVFISDHDSEDIIPLINSNILFGTQILEVMSKTGVKLFINTGTSWQHFKNQVYNPVNLYAATKQAFEDILIYFVQTGRVNAINLVLFDTYGPNDPRQKLFYLLAQTANEGLCLKMSPGNQMLDLVYIDDVVNAFLIAAKRLFNQPGIRNELFAVSSGKPICLRDLIEIYKQVTGKNLTIDWGGRPYREREVMHPWSLGEQLPGWSPKISLVEGISMITKNN